MPHILRFHSEGRHSANKLSAVQHHHHGTLSVFVLHSDYLATFKSKPKTHLFTIACSGNILYRYWLVLRSLMEIVSPMFGKYCLTPTVSICFVIPHSNMVQKIPIGYTAKSQQTTNELIMTS